MFTPRMFFFGAGLFMLLDGIGYSVGALIPIQQALAPKDAYLKRRLALNLLLANQGLYFAGLAALLGAYFADTQRARLRKVSRLCVCSPASTQWLRFRFLRRGTGHTSFPGRSRQRSS